MKKSNWIYLIIVILLSFLGFWFTLKSSGSIDWVTINPIFLLIVLLLMVLWWLFDSISVLFIFQVAGLTVPFFVIVKSMLIGFFFGAITPFGSGTIPAILFYLKSQHIDLKDCVSPVLMKSLLNGITRAVASLILAIYLKPMLPTTIGTVLQSVLFLYGTIILTFYFILIHRSLLASRLRDWLANFLFWVSKKIPRLTSFLAPLGESIKVSPERFSRMTKNLRWTLKTFLFIFLFWCAQLSIPYFILLSIKMNAPFFQTVMTQASYYLLQPYLPTPGGSGVAEAGYGLLSKSLGGHQNPQFIFLWRLSNFYLPLATGAIFFIGNLTKKKNYS